MSIIFVFTRITPSDAIRVTAEPDAAWDLIETARSADEPSGDLDQAWDGLRCLFSAAAVDFDLLGGDEPSTRQDCLRVWSATEVSAAARVLSATPFDRLAEHFSPELMDEEGAGPDIWDGDEALDYLREAYEDLQAFFTHAAATNSAAMGQFA
ncbi:YfbM family protein [Nocardia sp. NPDC055049]